MKNPLPKRQEVERVPAEQALALEQEEETAGCVLVGCSCNHSPIIAPAPGFATRFSGFLWFGLLAMLSAPVDDGAGGGGVVVVKHNDRAIELCGLGIVQPHGEDLVSFRILIDQGSDL